MAARFEEARRVTVRRPLAIAALVLGVAACAPRQVPWANPSLPEQQWSQDYSACKRLADREVGWREDEGSSPLRDYDRAQAKRQFDASLSSCMRERGYVPNRSKG
jgi:hypothetical protein